MIEESTIRSLAARCSDTVVMSFYLDVDGSKYPRRSDYEPHLDHLLRLARMRTAHEPALTSDQVEAALSSITRWLGSGIDRGTTRSVAAFCDATQGMFQTFTLPVSLRDQIVVDRFPDVAPLAIALARLGPTLVVVVDRQTSRLVRLGPGQPRERHVRLDEPERQVDVDVELGSFDRRHEERASTHHRRVARAVVHEIDTRGVRHLVLVGTREAAERLERLLPPRARPLVAGTISLPVTSSTAVLARQAAEVVARAEADRRDTVVQVLRERVGQRSSAVAGIGATLESLGAGRLTTLVVEDDFELEGGRCVACDRLVEGPGSCPSCGATTLGVSNVVDAAVSDVFRHHGLLEVCPSGELSDLGRIGALERA